jgi:predicted nucleic acid-binding protein
MLYLDTSALVKKYVEESRSPEVRDCIARHESIATATIARAECAATFARAVRRGSLTETAARAGHQQFVREWKTDMRIRITESLVTRADGVAWTYRLRGYDAVHLAAALEWHDRIEEQITVATFDQDLWRAAAEAGLDRFPAGLEDL